MKKQRKLTKKDQKRDQNNRYEIARIRPNSDGIGRDKISRDKINLNLFFYQ
jgi:hypothetical protein